MTEKKTAEEFLKKNASFEFEEWKRDCPGGYKLLMNAMKEHTAQELAEYKKRLKEAISQDYKVTMLRSQGLRTVINLDSVYQLIDQL